MYHFKSVLQHFTYLMYGKHFDLQDIKSQMHEIKNDLHEAELLLQKNEWHLQELDSESRII